MCLHIWLYDKRRRADRNSSDEDIRKVVLCVRALQRRVSFRCTASSKKCDQNGFPIQLLGLSIAYM